MEKKTDIYEVPIDTSNEAWIWKNCSFNLDNYYLGDTVIQDRIAGSLGASIAQERKDITTVDYLTLTLGAALETYYILDNRVQLDGANLFNAALILSSLHVFSFVKVYEYFLDSTHLIKDIAECRASNVTYDEL